MNKKCKKIVSGPKTFSCGDSGKKSEIELNEVIYYATKESHKNIEMEVIALLAENDILI